jgi:hypothetical protein
VTPSGFKPASWDQEHEGSRAAIQDRQLGAVHLHQHVVHAERMQRRKQMLDGFHADPVAAQGVAWSSRAKASMLAGMSTPISERRKTMPVSAAAGFITRRNRLARVQADPGATDFALQVRR